MPKGDGLKYFKNLQAPNAINVSRTRKVMHSASNKARTSSKRHMVTSTAMNFSDTAVTAVTVVSLGVAFTAGVGAFMTGPIVGSVSGIIAIYQMVDQMKTNREGAHRVLTPYVYQYLDPTRPRSIPSGEEGKKVKAAALALIVDGHAQQKLSGGKTDTAKRQYNDWVREYCKITRFHDMLIKSVPPNKKEAVIEKMKEQEPKRQAHLRKGVANGGPVFELMRRLIHRANYLQAYAVAGLIFQGEGAGSLPDLAKLPEVKATRKGIQNFADLMDKHADIAHRFGR